eukprot:TRINITY_DN19323_c0_g1_i1.p1 TRINITY_DN19323_c0_g1~~TRINITY_DN19323_c0_g1_i1.p1  ORF type:complete len:311 (+),score=65.20 TRINITY_DN19323_c0_g1_i1:36-968(+)
MAGRTQPIVITLKKRTAGGKTVDEAVTPHPPMPGDASGEAEAIVSEGEDDRGPLPARGRAEPADHVDSPTQNERNGRRASPPSPPPPPKRQRGAAEKQYSSTPAPAAALPSVLRVETVSKHIVNFQDQLSAWLQDEEEKLQRLQQRSQDCREVVQKGSRQVSDFLQDNAPIVFDEIGGDAKSRSFPNVILPRFLDMVQEDRQVLLDFSASLKATSKRLGLGVQNGAKATELLRAILSAADGSSRPARTTRPREKPRQQAPEPEPDERPPPATSSGTFSSRHAGRGVPAVEEPAAPIGVDSYSEYSYSEEL